jgi:hypothetical protein
VTLRLLELTRTASQNDHGITQEYHIWLASGES